MSSPAQPQPAFDATPIRLRTRIQPAGGSGKSVYLAAILLVLSVLGAFASRSYGKGGTAYIRTNAPGAVIRLDSGFAIAADDSGAAQMIGTPFGARTVNIASQDFEEFKTTLSVGWLSGNTFSLQLTPIPLTLTVNTMPAAEVLLNGQSAGSANSQGLFVKEGVTPGEYDIQVRLPGYNTFTQHRHLSPRFVQVFAGLNMSRERVEQIEQEQRRAQENASKVQQLMASARQKFNSRQYQAALASVEEALQIDPSNALAQQLKNQVVQTINILR